jgi:hypothetical protein
MAENLNRSRIIAAPSVIPETGDFLEAVKNP